MKTIYSILLFTCIFTFMAYSQTQVAGSTNYALGGSSVMKLEHSSALFLNPGELARIRYQEMTLSTNHFSTLPSISAVRFYPFLGTFGAGISNEFDRTQYSFGYARSFGTHQTLGGSINLLQGNFSEVTLSLGSSIHFPDAEERQSGLLAGVSVLNFSSDLKSPNFVANAGAGYWIVPKKFLSQFAAQYQNEETKFSLGAEYIVNSEFTVQLGTKSFEEISAGVSYTIPAFRFDLSAGAQGLLFTVALRFSDDPKYLSGKHFENGIKLYEDEQFTEASAEFRSSSEYDEYNAAASTYIKLAETVTETSAKLLLREARKYEEENNFLEAKKIYEQILKNNPNHITATRRLKEIKPQVHELAITMLRKADSLSSKKQFGDARTIYDQVVSMESDNAILKQRVTYLDQLISDSVSYYLVKAKSRMEKNQLELAKFAYEEVLDYDPDNAEAKTNLTSINAKIKVMLQTVKTSQNNRESLDKGKRTFEQKNYFEALNVFNEILMREPQNEVALDYVEKIHTVLLPKVEEYFKVGLQAYVDENYRRALLIWNNALTIKPDHQAILEYKKRAEQKLEALEKLKQ